LVWDTYLFQTTHHMKLCKDCNTKERLNGKSYCQSCYWIRFKENHKRNNPYRRSHQNKNREYIHRYKQICGCRKCKEKRYWVLDLHHVDPSDKDFDFHKGVSRSRDILKAEMRKCIVLCKNCHYDFHHLERVEEIKIDKYIK